LIPVAVAVTVTCSDASVFKPQPDRSITLGEPVGQVVGSLVKHDPANMTENLRQPDGLIDLADFEIARAARQFVPTSHQHASATSFEICCWPADLLAAMGF
jgi:hypothetical protein